MCTSGFSWCALSEDCLIKRLVFFQRCLKSNEETPKWRSEVYSWMDMLNQLVGGSSDVVIVMLCSCFV